MLKTIIKIKNSNHRQKVRVLLPLNLLTSLEFCKLILDRIKIFYKKDRERN